MPVKRARSSSRPRFTKRARTVRNIRRGVRRSRVRMSSTTHMFHRWGLPATYNSTTGNGSFNYNGNLVSYVAADGLIKCQPTTAGQKEVQFATSFCLSDLPNYTEFTALYDQYKIKMVKLQIKMINVPESYALPGSAASNLYVNYYPTIWWTQDHDDNNYNTVAQMREFARVKHAVLYPNREVTILVRPTVLSQLYLNNTTTGYATQFKQPWLDMANPGIPHYGVKAAIDFEGLELPIGGNNFQFKINAKYYFMCKNTR